MKNFWKAPLAGALVSMPGIVAAETAAPSPKDAMIYTTLTENDLADLVRGEGHTVLQVRPVDMPSIEGRTAEGLNFVLVGLECEQREIEFCSSVIMQVHYDSDERVSTSGVNTANINVGEVTTWWDESQDVVGFHRYVPLEGGVTWANIRANLRILIENHLIASNNVFP